MNGKRRIALLPLILLALIVLAGVVAGIHSCRRNSYHIWVIHSHEREYEQYQEYNKQLAKELGKRGVDAKLHFDYLYCNKFIEVYEDSIMKMWIDSVQTSGQWPDLIVVTEDQATYALLSTHRPELKQCPIIFGGVRFPNYPLLARYDNVTGTRDTVDFVESMYVLREMTGSLHAYTNLDKRFFDMKVEKLIKAQMAGKPFLDNLHWTTRLKHLYQLPADSMSITGLSMRDIGSNAYKGDGSSDVSMSSTGNGNFFWALGPTGLMHYLLLKFDATSHTLAIMSLREQFSGINNLFGTQGSALLAGYFSSIQTWAAEQADMAAKVLAGTPIREIPIGVSPKDYYVDWNVARKFHIPLEKIPSRYHLVNIPYKTLHPYIYWAAWITSYSLLLGALVLAVLAALRATRKKLRAYDELKEKQVVLELTSTFTQSFVWHSTDGVAEFDDAFWSYIDRPMHTVTRDQFVQWIHPDYRELYLENIQDSASGNTSSLSLQLLCDFRNEGTYNWWEMRAKGEIQPDGRFNMFGLLFNIDETKQREQELIEARKRMEEADLKESFLANMSHEIRTPLNAIVGFSNILATPGMELSDEEKSEFMETINKNNTMLLKLVNDILDISRIESGYMEFVFEQVAVKEFVDAVHQSYLVQAPRHLEFIYRPGGGADLKLFIDQTRAQQVLMNFLTNAAKFTPAGSITLGWKYHANRQEIEIFVEDTGIGLSKDDCILVFNRFYKKDEFKQGTGLGLSICRVIAERLHGRITVQSELEKGSRFSLWLRILGGGGG